MTTNTFVHSFKTTLSERWIAVTAILLIVVSSLLLGGALYSRLTARTVTHGDIVRIHYTVLVDDKSVYYSTEESEPMQYALGQGQLLPDLEAALLGMRVGEMKTVRLAPEQAYGPHRSELVWTVETKDLPEGSQPVVGEQIRTELENGSPLLLTITEVTDTMVTLDANHPLSGHNLTFEVELVGIEEGSPSSKQVY